jgi:serine/threonine-protein kinase
VSFLTLKGSWTTSLTLPTDLLRQGNYRLGILVLVYAAVYGLTAYLLPTPPQDERFFNGQAIHVIGAVFIATSVAFYFVLRSGRIGPAGLGWAGSAFQVYGAIGIEIGILTWSGDVDVIPMGLSWTTVWIVTFPFFVPSSPGWTFATSMVAASMRPLMFGILWMAGYSMPNTTVLAQITVPNYVCVGIAVLGARVVYGLGREVAEARRMGSYQLVEKLGEGGMGEVWVANHEMLARPAAIKLVRSDLTQEGTLLERFQREVQAASQLRSPHTIAVYDYGVTPDGVFYYVMELLDGIDLERLVGREGPLPVGRVVHILRQVCHSLAEAHGAGMVHRDVKPANIFLCRYGRDVDWVKLLDFGLVKQDAGSSPRPDLSIAGGFMGTPSYAAPELAREHGGMTVDGRADIYALGCVAYWLLTGTRVFESSSALETLMRHATEKAPPPSDLAEQVVPPELDRIILACIEKNPNQRIQTADELASRLDTVAAGLDGGVHGWSWSEERAREWWALHRGERPAPDAAFEGRARVPGSQLVSKWR